MSYVPTIDFAVALHDAEGLTARTVSVSPLTNPLYENEKAGFSSPYRRVALLTEAVNDAFFMTSGVAQLVVP